MFSGLSVYGNWMFSGLSMYGVGGEPSHTHGGYPQRPPLVRLSDFQYPQSRRRNARRVLQEAKCVWGLRAEAKVDSWHGSSCHHVGGGQKPEVAC
jgi:hypothetical protein